MLQHVPLNVLRSVNTTICPPKSSSCYKSIWSLLNTKHSLKISYKVNQCIHTMLQLLHNIKYKRQCREEKGQTEEKESVEIFIVDDLHSLHLDRIKKIKSATNKQYVICQLFILFQRQPLNLHHRQSSPLLNNKKRIL